MAKKKTAETANIKASPVLRADDGGGQDPSKTKSYCIRDDWKDINKVNYVAFKSVDGEVQDLTVNGEPAGGGGGINTVLVTISNNSQEYLTIALPELKNDTLIQSAGEAEPGDGRDYNIIVPTGGGTHGALIISGGQINVSTTGSINVTKIDNTFYEVGIGGAGSINVA